MAELKTQLDLQQIPKIVGEDGTQLLARCYAVLEHTRWPLYIVGPSGSGKSIIAMNLARQYALAKNVPAYYVQLSPEQTKTSLILGLRLENGSLAVKNGVVADCMERGGIIIVDEATHSVQEILLMFNSILDRTSVTAIGDKMIYAHEDFRIVFCSNDSRYSGNVKLPQSFAQRLVSFYFDYPTAEDELLIVEQIVAEECRANDVVPVSLKRYIIELMREVRSNTYPLSVRNAAIAVVLCNLELLRRPEWRQTMIDSYFYDNRNVESIKRYLAKRVLGCEAASVTDLTDRRIMELEQALSAIGIGTFKEIILQSFMYYLDVDFYMYYTGREDQSVNQQVMMKRIDQQDRVNRIIFGAFDLEKISNKKLRSYLYSYLQIMCTVTTVHYALINTEDSKQKKEALWSYMKKENQTMWRHLRFSAQGIALNLPGKVGRAIVCRGYGLAQRFFGFS